MKEEIRVFDVDKEKEKIKGMKEELDPLMPDALRIAITKDKMKISATSLRRNFQISYPRAARMIDQLESLGYIASYNNQIGKRVLLSLYDIDKIFGNEKDFEMQSSYANYCELTNKESITQEDFKYLHIPPYISLDFLLENLIKNKAIKKEKNSYKIISKTEFEKQGIFWFVYDLQGEISVSLKELIGKVLIYERGFDFLIKNYLDEGFSLDLSNEEKQTRLQQLFDGETNEYLLQILAVEFIARFLKENASHFLNEDVANKVINFVNNR